MNRGLQKLINLTEWNVIVVEDTFDDIQLVSAILRYHDIQVTVANNGRECLELLQDIQPTLIITDLAMPEMDGWQTLNQIRADDRTRDIPVIAVTAYDSVDVAHDAVQAGFDAYFPKPLSPRTLIQNLINVIE